jgi:hypothetical protein
MGFFDKISSADVLILMDNAQLPKSDGTWTNRVQIIIQGQVKWITVPIVRTQHGTQSIQEAKIDNSKPWRKKLLKTLQMNYARAPYFRTVFPFIEELVNRSTDSLSDYNIGAIQSLTEVLGLDPSKLVLGSTLDEGDYTIDVVTRVISMVKAVNGTAFLCGGDAAYLCGGMDGYPKNERFSDAGVELINQNFIHPAYLQINTIVFIPGLSIIDALFNCGFEGTREILC